MRIILLLFSFILSCHFYSSGQAGVNSTCHNAAPFCGSNAYTYPAGTCGLPTGCNAQPGPCYQCLSTTPNPAWFYMQIGTSGNIIISISENPYEDVDFICWGPFTTPTGACDTGLICSKVVSCSYSPSGNETCSINNAVAGQFYLLLITNYSNQATEISFVQSNYGQPGAGTTNCNIVVFCSISAISTTPTSCDPGTNTFNVSGNIEFSNPPTTGTLTITDNTATPPVSQTFFPPFVSPQAYSLTGIPCDGSVHTLSAAFSDSTGCQLSQNYQSPPSDCPSAVISGGGIICNNGSNTGTVQISVTGGSAPYSFTYAINSVPQTPVVNYSGPFPYIITTLGSGTFTLVSVSDNACPGTVSGIAVVLFVPLPTVTLSPFNPLCITAPPFPLSGGSPPGGTYSGAGVTGGVFNPSTAGAGTHTITYTYTDNNNCTNSAQSNIIVYLLPVVTVNPVNEQICSGAQTNINFQSTIPGSSFSWTATTGSPDITGFSNGTGAMIIQTLFNSGNTIDSVTYVVTPHANGCDGIPVSFSVKVAPVPGVITIPVAPSICSAQTTNIQLSSGVSGATFTWTANGSSHVTGYFNGSGNNISQTLISDTGIVETVTYHITPSANGCAGNQSDLPVIINPKPHLLTNPMQSTICSGTGTNITLVSTCLNTIFTWTANLISGNVTGFSNGSGTPITQNLTDNLVIPGEVQYIIQPTAGTCIGDDTIFFVTVNPKPTLTTTPLTGSVCSNMTTGILLSSDVPGAIFTWTATASSPNVTGFTAGSGSTIAQTLSNSGTSNETVTYHINPSASGCTGTTTDFVVTVFPVPDLSNSPATKQLCSNVPTGIALSSDITGTLFTWICTPSSGNITGWSDNSIPAVFLNQVLINSGTLTETVTYHITPQANGCNGFVSDFVVTVYPTPDLSNSPSNKQICNNTPTNIQLTSDVPGTLFTWTATGSSGSISGYSDNAIPVTIINQTLHNTGYAFETVTYHVMPHASGCSGISKDFIVTVNPTTDVYFNPASQVMCSMQQTNIQNLSHVTGTTFTWNASGSSGNVSGFTSGNGNLIQQTLTNSLYNIETVTYQVSPSSNLCPGISANVIITVDPLPVVLLSSCWDSITTTDAQPVKLKGGLPLGGNYSGAGVSNDIFYPGIAGSGAHTITYSFVNSFGCNGTSGKDILVAVVSIFGCGDSLLDIRDNRHYPTVQIGSQCWMASNLNYGSVIASSLMQRDNCIAEKYCYNNIPGNCTNFGGLYQWDELMKFDNNAGVQGLCPPGWHIPAETEWTTLFDFFTSNGFAGNPLKITGFSGFNAAFDGIRSDNVKWNFNGFATMIWSSTGHGTGKAWAHGMNSNNPSVSYYPSFRSNAFSVRCLKD